MHCHDCGVFGISAAHLYLPKLPWRPPPPVRLVKEWILMLLAKKKKFGPAKGPHFRHCCVTCECNVMHPPFFIWYGFSSDLFLIVYSTQYMCKGKLQWHCFFNLSIIFCLSCLLLNDFTPFEGISTFANLFVDVR